MAETDDPWQAWLELHGASLLLAAHQWTASHADAQDALQEGFVKFWRTRGRAQDPLAYLFFCVRSAAMDAGRSQRRRKIREARAAISAPPPEPLFCTPAESEERRAAIEAALALLPPEQREVVILKIWAGLTFEQIARILQLSANTTASRYRYAAQKLAAQLKGVEYEP